MSISNSEKQDFTTINTRQNYKFNNCHQLQEENSKYIMSKIDTEQKLEEFETDISLIDVSMFSNDINWKYETEENYQNKQDHSKKQKETITYNNKQKQQQKEERSQCILGTNNQGIVIMENQPIQNSLYFSTINNDNVNNIINVVKYNLKNNDYQNYYKNNGNENFNCNSNYYYWNINSNDNYQCSNQQYNSTYICNSNYLNYYQNGFSYQDRLNHKNNGQQMERQYQVDFVRKCVESSDEDSRNDINNYNIQQQRRQKYLYPRRNEYRQKMKNNQKSKQKKVPKPIFKQKQQKKYQQKQPNNRGQNYDNNEQTDLNKDYLSICSSQQYEKQFQKKTNYQRNSQYDKLYEQKKYSNYKQKLGNQEKNVVKDKEKNSRQTIHECRSHTKKQNKQQDNGHGAKGNSRQQQEKKEQNNQKNYLPKLYREKIVEYEKNLQTLTSKKQDKEANNPSLQYPSNYSFLGECINKTAQLLRSLNYDQQKIIEYKCSKEQFKEEDNQNDEVMKLKKQIKINTQSKTKNETQQHQQQGLINDIKVSRNISKQFIITQSEKKNCKQVKLDSSKNSKNKSLNRSDIENQINKKSICNLQRQKKKEKTEYHKNKITNDQRKSKNSKTMDQSEKSSESEREQENKKNVQRELEIKQQQCNIIEKTIKKLKNTIFPQKRETVWNDLLAGNKKPKLYNLSIYQHQQQSVSSKLISEIYNKSTLEKQFKEKIQVIKRIDKLMNVYIHFQYQNASCKFVIHSILYKGQKVKTIDTQPSYKFDIIKRRCKIINHHDNNHVKNNIKINKEKWLFCRIQAGEHITIKGVSSKCKVCKQNLSGNLDANFSFGKICECGGGPKLFIEVKKIQYVELTDKEYQQLDNKFHQ